MVSAGDLTQISLITQQFAKSQCASGVGMKPLVGGGQEALVPTPPGTHGASYSAVAGNNTSGDTKRKTSYSPPGADATDNKNNGSKIGGVGATSTFPGE